MSKRLVSVTLFLVTVVPSQTPQQPTWSLLTPTASPPGRYNFAMAHDPVRARTVMFGGHPGPSNDAWEFDGVTWAQRTPTIVPPARCCHTMAYVPAYANIVLFGGSTSSNDVDSLDDTWQWDGATWTQLAPSTSPSARMAQAMATDWLAGQVVLFGGRDTQSQHQGDTWTWNGTTWTLITSSGPPPRCCHSMAQDIASGRIVMFGGWAGVDQGDTWEFDGTSWQQAIPTGSAPSPRWGHRIAYDPVNGRLVLRGGFNGGSLTGAETWQWNGRQWTLLTLTALQTYNHELAFDWSTGRILGFGGVANPSDTWEFSTPAPAGANPFGTACAGSGSAPLLSPRRGSLPWIDQTFDVVLGPVPGFALVAFGLSNTASGGLALPFALAPYGAPGCAVLVSPDAVQGIAATPTATVAMAVPPVLALVGVVFYVQGLVLDAAANALGVTTSNGMAMTIGW